MTSPTCHRCFQRTRIPGRPWCFECSELPSRRDDERLDPAAIGLIIGIVLVCVIAYLGVPPAGVPW